MYRLAENLFPGDREETPGDVLFFKAFELFVTAFTIELAWTWGFYVRRISDVVLPLGLAQHIDISFMFGHDVSLVNAAAISILVLLGFFRVHRLAYTAAFSLLLLQYAARFCLGEIPHSANMLGMTLLGLSLATLLFTSPSERRRFTLGFTYFFVGLSYTLAAASKLIATGPLWVEGHHLWMWIFEKGVDAYSKTGLLEFNPLQQMALDSYAVATAFLTVGLLTELFAFLAWWRRFRMPVLLAIIGLHVGICLVMDILFKLSLYELILLALPWSVWIDRALQHHRLRTLVRPIQGLSLRFA